MPSVVARRAFRNPANQPQGGEYVFWSEDGVPLARGYDRVGFTYKVQAVLCNAGENVSPDEAWRRAMDNMCRRLPAGFCTGPRPDKAGVTIPEVKKITQELFACQAATPGEVAERLTICLSCPKHDRSICTSCDGLSAWAVRGVKRTRVPADNYAGICLVDRAFVSALVSVTPPASTLVYPESCWRKNNV